MNCRAEQTLFCLASVLFLYVAADQHAPEVHTKLGGLRGEYLSVKGTETGVHAYLGVPFAKPPVGPALRLAAPQPVEGWEGVRDATQQPCMCIQNKQFTIDLMQSLIGMLLEIPDISEDCLYLNIYTPANRAPSAKLPVMVWIHGGGFTSGAASLYDGSALAAYQDVVVVAIQYRLGLLGLFSTGDEHASGNFGLLDQVQALRWVQQHIHNFGGNPDLVTIFGESAGGMSVSLLLLSPLTDGLLHHGIAESGTAAIDVIGVIDPLPVAKMIANMSGCSLESTKKMADCMKNLDLDTILTFGMDVELNCPINVDGHFLTKPVPELYQKHELLKVPFMTGVNNDEGGWLLPAFFAPPNWTEGMDKEQVVAVMSMFATNPDAAIGQNFMVEEYIGSGEDRVKNRDGFTQAVGDIMFTIPAIVTSNAHRDAGAPVYLYEYQHAPKFLQEKRPSFVGSDHGDELFAVFGFCFTTTHVSLSDACTEEEEQLGKTMMSYWANFARTGSPNGDGLAHWPQYGVDEEYLEIDLKEQLPRKHLKKDRFVFITQTIPEKIKQHKEKMEHAPVVHTKLGGLRGEYLSVKGTEAGVHAYLGVPFAKPPVGPALRLAAPQPVEGWEGVRDATQQPRMCIQNKQFTIDLMQSLIGMLLEVPDISEDCLYLNIYTPANRAPSAKLPVMVWIHGGGFAMGAASLYDGSALAAYQDVVVVAIQYRLGLLGFFSTGDEHASGNFGLLDQVQALRWVQQHIHNFGGNPDLVTIFGESAGGMSVSLLLLSPLTDGLLHHGIAESGTAALDLLIGLDPLPVAKMVANMSGCSLESTEKMAYCMRNLHLDTILTLGKDVAVNCPINVDGHFLTKPVPELYQKHELLKVPFMTGVNNDEGGWLFPHFFAPPNWTEGMDKEQIVAAMSLFATNPDAAIGQSFMVEEYIGSGEDRVKNRDGFTQAVGDIMFTIPAIVTSNAHRDAGAPVYLYEYQHTPKFLQEKRPSFVGSDHGDELFAVFGFCFTTTHVSLSDACTEEEEQLGETMMNYWANFARTGSPNGDGLAHWPTYGVDEEYLEIDLKEQLPRKHLKKDRFVFITQTIPEKIKQHKEKMEHAPVVHTKLGGLRGEYLSVKGTEAGVHAYLGIPFAKPPVGPALRLAAPQPVEGWEGVRDATQQPRMCIQNKQITIDLMQSLGGMLLEIPDISEDCLYLNIYTPANRAPSAKLPVMVWIHGGGFAMGAASLYDGAALAAYQDVVVVAIQYRLGLLGFFSTGDEHTSGNFGLLDQVQALRWVQQHIHNFGGNPDLVTIFGESAGGMSVSLLLLSPLTDGLLHHGIAESGTAALDLVVGLDPLPVAKMVANMSGCSLESTEKMADCMRNLHLDTILTLGKDVAVNCPINVDGHFLTKPVPELYQKHELLKVPFMTGVNNDEGGWLFPRFLAPPNWTEGMDKEQIVAAMSLFATNPDAAIGQSFMVEEYIGSGEDRVKNRDGFTQAVGDIMFTIPAIVTSNAHRDAGAPVYLYEYQHTPKFLQEKRPSFVGSDHGDELFAVLGFCFTTTHVSLSDACTEEEGQLGKTMMSYWANFARTGSPNGDGLAHWPTYGVDEDYLEIDLKEQLPRKHLKKDRFVFITQTIPEKIKQHKEKMEHSEL